MAYTIKFLTGTLFICCFFLLFNSIAIAADHLLVDALSQQIKNWDELVLQGMGSRKCNEAFHGSVENSTQHEDVVAGWERSEKIGQLCQVEHDVLGEGLIWTDLYLKLSLDEKGQILNRPYLLGAIYKTLVLLNVEKLDLQLRASLTALKTETEHNSQNFSEVIALADNAEAQFTALGVGNSLSLVIAISNKAYAKYKEGNPEAGLNELLRALRMLYQIAPSAKGQLSVIYKRLATLYDTTGQYRQAIEYNEKAKKLFDEFGSKENSANLSFNKGIIQLNSGLHDQAIESLTEAKKYYLLNGKEKELGSTFFNLGKVWYAKDNRERALNFYEQAERILGTQQDHVELANVYVSMGILHENLMTEESYSKAQQYYEQAENLFHTYSARPQEYLPALLINKGKLYERWGRYEDAQKEYQRAEKYFTGTDPHMRLVINNNLAYIALLKDQNDQALDYAQKAIKYIEEIFKIGFFLAGTPNLNFLDQHSTPYHVAVEALIRKGDLKRAYVFREESRNKLFQILVHIKGEATKEQNNDALWQQKQELDRALSTLDHRAVRSQSDDEQASLISKRHELKKRLGSVERGFFSNPDLDQKIFKKASLDIKKLQSNLKEEEALIDYHIIGKTVSRDIQYQIDAFIIKRNNIKHVKLTENMDAFNGLENIKEYCNLQRPQSLKQYHSNNALKLYDQSIQAGSKILYQNLFEKIDSELTGITSIYIIPEGLLNFLPFETLRDQQDKFLIEKYAISYLNSAADVYQDFADTNKGLLIFGDIDYGPWKNRLSKWSSITGSSIILDDIKNSMQEKMQVTYVHNTKATESCFNEISAGHKIILIWSHGEFSDYSQLPENIKKLKDGEDGISINTSAGLDAWSNYQYRKQFNDPLSNSFVVLAAVNQGGDGRNDGYLTAREVMGLNLQGTELTILAACETGLGQSSPSEGIVGLKKAFSLAGSRQLLISLWQVDAPKTGEFVNTMLLNYEKQGGARALQTAKIALIKKINDEGLEPFPFYWAGFILVGKGD